MPWMAFFRKAQVMHCYTIFAQERCRCGATALMCAMRAPSGDDLPCVLRHLQQNAIVFRSNRCLGGAHRFWVRVAPRKYIGHAKAAEPQHARAAFASFNGGVILELVRS